MSQKESWEVICKRCSYKDILDHEPSQDHVCSLCHYRKISDKEKEIERFSIDKPKRINMTPRIWRCGNHNKSFRWRTPCPECIAEYAKKHLSRYSDVQIPNLKDTNTQMDIEVQKVESEMRKKIREKLVELQEAPLKDLVLTKQLIENEKKTNAKLDKLIEIMEDKNGA